MLQENRHNSKKQNQLIKELTKKKKAEAEEEATLEVLGQNRTIKKDYDIMAVTPEQIGLSEDDISLN